MESNNTERLSGDIHILMDIQGRSTFTLTALK